MNRQNYIDAVVKVISNRGIRNSTLAIFELTSLKNFGIDVSTNMKLVEDYRNILKAQFKGTVGIQEYMKARDKAWELFLDSLADIK